MIYFFNNTYSNIKFLFLNAFASRVRNLVVARRWVQSGGDRGHVEGPDGAGQEDGGKGATKIVGL